MRGIVSHGKSRGYPQDTVAPSMTCGNSANMLVSLGVSLNKKKARLAPRLFPLVIERYDLPATSSLLSTLKAPNTCPARIPAMFLSALLSTAP
jgi:hypothetical protein